MKAVVISDIHLGNPKMNIDKHLKELRKWLLTYKDVIISSDFFIISGDLFDNLLTLGVTTDKIFSFFKELDYILGNNDITLLVLEGTLSHEYKQSSTLPFIFNLTEVRYYDDIIVDTIKGVDMLFVPDSLPLTPEEYSAKTKEVLAAKGISSVKLSVMHGMFKHHIDIPTVEVLDQELYSQISDLVIIGHNHRYQKWNNIYTPGSLSRDRHGEEDDKVGLLVDLDTDKVTKLVNKHTRLFITIFTKDYDNINDMISKVRGKYKEGTSLSIKGEKLSADYKSEIRVKLPLYKLSFSVTDKDEVLKEETENDIVITRLDKDTITEHLEENISSIYLKEELSRVL